MILKDGFSTIITLGLDPTIKWYETEVTPPSLGVGKNIDMTTMRNLAWRTSAPAVLKSLGPIKLKVGYDPAILNDSFAQVGINQLVTVTFSNGATLAFYGYVDSFTPSSIKEGTRPVADVSIIPTMMSNANPQVETAPVYMAGS